MSAAIKPNRRAYHQWSADRELSEKQAAALLSALGRVGFVLDTTPGDVHMRMHTGEGWERICGFLTLHGREPARER